MGYTAKKIVENALFGEKKITMNWKIGLIASVGLTLVSVSEASAGLTTSYQFNGLGNWAIDGVGGNTTPVGNIEVSIPEGSTVEQAFLYSSMFSFSGPLTSPTVIFDAMIYSGGDFISLGAFQPQPIADPDFYLGAWRTDVTAQVAAKVGQGSATPFSFSVDSENPNNNIDGEVLAVVYSNPNEQERTIAILDGFSATDGDVTRVDFVEPIDPTETGFEALLSLGIGFGFQGIEQASQVDINGQRLTSAAGGQDDGTIGNGTLITVGGTGDSPDIPANPLAGPNGDPRFDDELYNLALGSFLSAGDTSLLVETLNPSNDDNIFFLGLNVTAEGDVCVGDECETVPEPSSILGLLTLGILGAGVKLKKK